MLPSIEGLAELFAEQGNECLRSSLSHLRSTLRIDLVDFIAQALTFGLDSKAEFVPHKGELLFLLVLAECVEALLLQTVFHLNLESERAKGHLGELLFTLNSHSQIAEYTLHQCPLFSLASRGPETPAEEDALFGLKQGRVDYQRVHTCNMILMFDVGRPLCKRPSLLKV